ncbi:MAG TPA: hypothetical protein VGP24_14165 [Glaciihabitans sp.]|jgi:hypothetical protein|nr:hypothetical protein [Glaciihabitans sp.]
MNKTNLVTVLCVVAAVVIAWVLVNFLLSAVFFLVKVAIVLVVAAVVYVFLRGFLSRNRAS